jgi:antitoxin VapB
MIVQTKVHRRNGRQSIRIPSEFAPPDEVKEVRIIRSGADLLICPVGRLKSWKEFFEHGPWVSEDFMSDRVDPPPRERELPD